MEADTTLTYIPVKLEKSLRIFFMSYQQKCVFAEVAFNGKILAAQPNIFELKVRNLDASFISLSLSLINEEATLTVSKVSFLLKHATQMWLLTGE